MQSYSSKMDTWLAAVFVVAAVIAIFACVTVARVGGSGSWLIAVVTLALGIGLPAWICATTRYELTAQHLLVRSGPFNWTILLEEITAVSPTSNPLSSPALSLDRLRIDYVNGRLIMISPRDKEGFLHELRRLGVPA